ncbi:putative mediator of RNA polymerase II transcription subunit 26 isoform X2 [Calliphora vicina]|uniref:putative mediator of RNA polymerase II transcription subunit 26 isoform X2 n=1 Tax=Calliphora vicina TaxID=7373 RepID=UPI00325B65E9
MEMSMERDSSALGSLFQQIINDMKNTSPLWEDFVAKASKLHACLRAAIQAIAAYLDAFQKIADAATNSRGASKEIGTALTRVCLRHKAVETRLKTFTAAIMDCLVQPLQDKLEDWKRSVATIDKEHAKEYKRCRTELKKRSTDTLRLQKKARKGQSDTLQSLMDSHMQDVTLRRAELEEVEKKSLRSAMIEERMRYCSFVHMLQPVVKEECEVMSELGHLQEAMQSIALVTKEPQVLPAASEELIHDAKASITLYPESPSASAGGGGSLSQGGCSNSLGSRKSSVCSISSMNSSGSSNSPGHPHYPRSLSQLISPSIRLKPGESSDSGFCSSPALTTQASSINNPSHAVTTWPTHSQDTVDLPSNASERPHTISSAYEKGHQRPPLTVYTFQNPETIHEAGGGVNAAAINNGSGGGGSSSGQNTPSTQKSPAGALTRPPLPVRCSSLERPLSANNSRGNGTNLMQRQCPSPIPAHVTKELSAHLAQQQHQQQLLLQQQQQPNHQQTSPPTYVNMSELANMAAMKITNQQQQQLQQQQQQSPTIHQQQQMLQQQHSIDSISSIHSNDSSASMHLNQSQQLQHVQTTPPSHHQQQSTRSHSSNSNTPSLHSHPSIESTVATPPIGQTPSASSGSSTPQNHYSPLLTNSPSSTAAGTPSGASITSSGLTTSGAAGGTNSGNNFMYNVCSPTPPQSANSSQASDILKITESDGNNGIVVAPSPLTSQTNDSNAYSSNSANNQEISNSNTDADSSGNVVENDERSRASVLQKASMFEKQAAAVKSTPTPPAIASCSMSRNSVAVAANIDNSTNAGIYGTRTSNQSQHQQQQSQSIDPQEVDKCFEDSLQELNNLIGELDSFQREIDASKQDKEHHKNVKNLYDGIDSYISNETMTIITDDTSTTIICETTQQQHLQQSQQEKDFCTASNQTNSSGCGTDISDTTSEDCNADTRSLTSQTGVGGCGGGNELIGGLLKTNLKALSGGAFNSDSELSRCYISETSSIMGGCAGDGYENPTFAHFAASSSASQCYDDNRSDSLSLQRQAMYGDNMSDNGSNVVVIYDHQPPITPDIDYCKQNSEIVMLRTKPAQHSQYSQEMRELQQLPDNLTETSSPTSPNGTTDHSMHQHTATVAPAKQRLSSFRASSEQLQLLNSSPTAAATTKAATIATATSSSTTTPSVNSCSSSSETVIRKKLPPKPPSLTVFQGITAHQMEVNNNSNLNNNKSSKLVQTPPKLDFKSDLEAKLLKQKEKLKKQQELEKQQQQQQKQLSPTSQQQKLQQPQHHNINNSINFHAYKATSPSSSSPPLPAFNSVSSSASLNVVMPPLPPPLPSTNTNNNHNVGSMLCNTSPAPLLANVAKPSITPRPASLSGSTRIARRSSVNTAKPPPPVRRSSSVTPSPNTPTTPTNSNAINMLHQQQAHSLNTSTENLPPPPAYLLDARQTTPTSPPSVMPNSSQKVSETVKALSGLRHQPASPHTLRRLQQQQQQQQQQHQPQSMLQPPKQYQHQYTKSSPVLLSPPTTKRTMPTPLSPQSPLQTDLDEIPPPLPPPNPNQTPHHHHQHQLSLPLRYQQQLPTPTMTAHSNNNHMPPQQQLQHHQQQQLQHQYQDHQQLDYNNGEAIYGTNSPTSFRTSSPGGGIYAQPKILNNMSSFRTNSPGPNGHQTPTQSHVPAQPKTNPNLIAQLNARLNSKQPSSNEAIYGVSSINHQQQREEIYMRNYQQLTPHASQPPPPQQQQQQQQTYDAAETNANATFNTNQNQYSSSQYYAPKHLTAAHQQQPTQQHVQKVANATNNQPSRQLHQSMPMSQSPLPPPELAAQQSHYQTGHQHQPQQQREPIHHTAQHYTCPPPLEDPPPPPIYINNNSATMPKRGASSHHNHHHQQPANLATYAAASSVSTLPKNMIQQQRLQQQQQQQLQLQQQQQAIYGTHQAQQQQYHAPGAITSAHQQAQQYQNPQHISQRPPMPLPHHQQQQQQQQQQSSSTGNRHKAATVNIKQPPVPSRHSSVQQKIFVATNPFIQTTTIHCHSPTASSVHSQPASPICSSPTPSSVASIYGTSSRRSSGSGGGNSGGVGMAQYDVGGGGNAGQVYYNHQLNTATNTNYTSTNVDKNASIRTKTKAEFLENLNAKLAKQSLSGRAFAVRNLINSKALMYQNLQNLKRPSAQYRNLPLFDTNSTSTTICDEAL